MREQGVVLEYGVDVALVGRYARSLDTVDADRTAGGLLEACDQAQAGGLARARGAEHGEEFAIDDVDADLVDGLDLAEGAGNLGELDG